MIGNNNFISIMLCAAMGVSLLAGCGGSGDSASSSGSSTASSGSTGSSDGTYDEFITVDVFDGQANYQGIQSGWFAKIVKDKFNLNYSPLCGESGLKPHSYCN